MLRFTLAVGITLGMASQAHAASITGTWLTEPDAKAQVGHVEIAPCGAALCATIVRAYDRDGRQIVTPNVGRKVMWDLVETGGVAKGRAYVPILRQDFPVTVREAGGKLSVRACNAAGLCQSQVWSRVK